MDDKTKDYIARLDKHQDTCGTRAEYALKRLDIVIIALSSSGLLLCFSYLKDHPGQGKMLLAPVLLFVVAILANILSQWFGYYANLNEYDWTEAEIYMEKERARVKKEKWATIINECQREKELSGFYTKWTNRINIAASISLGLGILVLLGEFTFLVFY